MVRFLDLPRELRDAIYIALVAWERPLPDPEEAQSFCGHSFVGGGNDNRRWTRISEPGSMQRGEFGCSYSTQPMPSTCGNFMACNRQIRDEMAQVIARARRRGGLAARLDCIAKDESFHYFSWRCIPLVKTVSCAPKGKAKVMLDWADWLMGRYLLSALPFARCDVQTTTIDHLWVDVRLFGSRRAKWHHGNVAPPDRTSWAVCAALKHAFTRDGLLSPRVKTTTSTSPSPSSSSPANIFVNELVLNVVSPDRPPEDYIPVDFPLRGPHPGIVHPYTVARELVDVWHAIWSGRDFRAAHYRSLLEQIRRVRVCVDGATWRVRELKLELERGQAERRRIAARGVW